MSISISININDNGRWVGRLDGEGEQQKKKEMLDTATMMMTLEIVIAPELLLPMEAASFIAARQAFIQILPTYPDNGAKPHFCIELLLFLSKHMYVCNMYMYIRYANNNEKEGGVTATKAILCGG